jgi:hypothetical protein
VIIPKGHLHDQRQAPLVYINSVGWGLSCLQKKRLTLIIFSNQGLAFTLDQYNAIEGVGILAG